MRLLPNLSQAGGALKTLSQMLSFKLVPLGSKAFKVPSMFKSILPK